MGAMEYDLIIDYDNLGYEGMKMSSKSHVILIPYDMSSNFDSIHSTLVVVSKRDVIQISSQISSHFSK